MNICHVIGPMSVHFPPHLHTGDSLLGVDGGYAHLLNWNLTPHGIVGDFDSLGYTPDCPEGSELSLLPVRKDETDMEYALKWGRKKGFSSFLIQGGLGGRPDHSYANYQLLLQLSLAHCHGIFIGEWQNVTIIREETLTFPPTLSGTCSVFAVGEVAQGVTLTGLSYLADNVDLSPWVPLGVSNAFLLGESACISVKKGAVLVFFEGEYPQETYETLLSSFG